MERRYRPTGRPAVSSIALSICVASMGSFAGAQVLDEITVTAQKREQNLQDVGIAITAFSGNQLEALGITESTDIIAQVPGVHMAFQNGGQARQLTIRGVGQNDFGDHAEPPNAVYIDEGYLPAQQTQVFATFDLERVEILKGPQGTLFGRNATGGLAHYITRKPTEEVEAYADLTYGSYNQVRFEGAAGGPLSDKFLTRLSVMYNRHDPVVDNTYPDGAPANPDPTGPEWYGSPSGAADLWNDNQWALRGQGLWKINEDAELLVSGFGARQKVNSGPYQARATTAILDDNGNHIDSIFAADDPQACEAISASTGACVGLGGVDGELAGGFPGFAAPEDRVRPVQGGDLWGYFDPDLSNYDTSTDFAAKDFNRYSSYGATAKLTWDMDGKTLTAISHYIHSARRFALDVDSGPAPQLITMADQNTDGFTQEIRLNGESEKLNWVAGLYYLWVDAQHNQGLANSPGGPFTTTLYPCLVVGNAFDPEIGCISGLPPLEANTLATVKTNSYSAFGQVDYDITPELTLVAGIRVILEEKDFDSVYNVYINTDDRLFETDTFIAEASPPYSESTSDWLWSGKVQLEYRPNDDLLLYAGVNRGVKAGSFNAPLVDGSPRLADEDFGYKEEVLIAYEVGFKASLFDRRARLNGSVYYYDYNDYQAFLFKLSSGAIFNRDAEYKGFELELAANPVDNLDVMLGAAYIDATIKDVAVATGVLRDVRPLYTPKWQLSGLVRYQWPNILYNGTVAVQVDGNYVGESYDNIRNFQTHLIPDHLIGNARLSWTSENDLWNVQLFVTNVADKRYRTSGYDLSTLCGCSEQAWGKPRWWGLGVRYNFN